MARIIVYAIFAGFGLVLLYVGLTQFFQQRRLLRAAQPVEAVILSSRVTSSTSKDTDGRSFQNNSTTTHSPDVRFRYTIAGVEHESEMLYPSEIQRTYATSDAAAAELAPFPQGARVRAWVDPTTPDKAFLIAQSSAGLIVFIVLGIALPPIAWFASRLV